MTTTEPRRTADLAGPPNYLEGTEEHLGRPVQTPAEHTAHGEGPGLLLRLDLRDFLAAALRVFAEDDGAGKVLAGPFPMRLGGDGLEMTPDVLFVAAERLDRLTPQALDGPADLAVTIAAESTWAGARHAYERAGVREYWLIDPGAERAEFRARAGDGGYTALPVEDSGIFRSTVLPLLWMRMEWLFDNPLPLLRRVLIEWGLPRLFAD